MVRKVFLWLLLVSLVFPLIFFYHYLFPVSAISTGEALSSLAHDLRNAASKKRLEGYILSVEDIEGPPDEAIKSLKADINAVLFVYNGWKVLVDERNRAAVKDKIDIYMKRWRGLLGEEPFYRMIQKEAGTVKKIKFYPHVFWEYIPEKRNQCKLTLNIIGFDTKQKILSVSTVFTHPKYYSQIGTRKKVVKFGTYISVGVFAVSLGILIMTSILITIKKKRIIRDFPAIMERLENYSRQGHFVAAQKLVEQCIRVLPENTDLTAFKERLEDYCGNDPKKAQVAYVEMLKLKKRISERSIPALESREENQLSALIPYSPELKITYEEYSKITEEEKRKKQERVRKCFEQAEAEVKNMKISGAEKLLREAIEINPDFTSARDLLGKIESARSADILTLIPEKTGKEILVTKKEVLTFGRDNADIVIPHKMISRPHLKIMVIGNKVIAEDLNSTNGNYHRGEKISKSVVSDGDIIDLAHAYRFVFHVCMEKPKISAAQQTLAGGESPPIPRGEEETNGIYIEGDDRDFLIVKRSVPVDFKTTGMAFEFGRYRICLNEGVFFLTSRLKTEPLFSGGKIEEKGLVYNVV
ncbi:MAG: FHA domain-containing protein [bacterium]